MEPVRIVPLREDIPAARPNPEFTYRGGPLLTQVEAVTVFIGAEWPDALARDLDAFFDFVVTSELIDQLAEYDVGNTRIEHGSHVASARLPGDGLATLVTDDELRALLQDAIARELVPRPTANTLYNLFLPSGVAVELQGTRSCQVFCGYHDAIDGRIFYSVLPAPDCRGCGGDEPPLDALTVTASHELAEAITDPIPGLGWYDDTYGEIGDVCPWQTKKLGDYVVQLEWSNAARACV
jgi:hypothetical protein